MKKFILNKIVIGLCLASLTPISFAITEYNTVSEIPRFTSVSYEYGTEDTATTIKVEKDLKGKFDYAQVSVKKPGGKTEVLEKNGEKLEFWHEKADSITINAQSNTQNILTIKYFRRLIDDGDDLSNHIVWQQDIYLPGKTPVNANNLAKKYMPIVVFNENEEYFPQSLDDILDYKVDDGSAINISSNDEDEQKDINKLVKMGAPIKEYLKYNGHNKFFMNFTTKETVCELEDRVATYTNPANARCTYNPTGIPGQSLIVNPQFLRFSTGDINKPTVYWDATIEGSKVYLMYYFFYPFDPKNKSSDSPASAAHAFDRESFMVVLQKDANGKYIPEETVYAGHLETQDLMLKDGEDYLVDWSSGKTAINWNNAQKIDSHPIIYKAQGAHAIYPVSGVYKVDQGAWYKGGETLTLEEEAGSENGDKYILPNNPNLDLRRLDLNTMNYLSYSGEWVDMRVLKKGAKFPPFIRTPFAEWLKTTRNPTDATSPISDFDNCFISESTNFYTSQCNKVREKFEFIKGLGAQKAVTVKVLDKETLQSVGDVNVILMDASYAIPREIERAKTNDEGKYTFFNSFTHSPYKVNVELSHGELVECAVFNKGYGLTLNPLENNTPPMECKIDFTQSLDISNTTPDIGERIIMFIKNIGDNIKSVLWKIGDTVKNITTNVDEPIEYVPTEAGELNVSATLRDADGNKVETLQDTVTVKAVPADIPTLTTTPTKPTKGQAFSVQLNGGSSDKFHKVLWQWDSDKQMLGKDKIYQPFSIPATASEGKGSLAIKATLYDVDGDELGMTQKVVLFGEVSTTLKLTATGIKWCANRNENMLDCTLAALGADWFGLQQDGEVQAGEPLSYTTLNQNGAECVRDNVTGLIWEQKTDDGGLRDKDNTYTWYNPDSTNNGGYAGTQNGGSCTGSACDTQAYIQALNNANYCGYSDWRLPTKDELVSIVDYGRVNPAINPIFSHTQSNGYWSASPYASSSNYAWYVNFNNGNANDGNKNNSGYVRGVRASQ